MATDRAASTSFVVYAALAGNLAVAVTKAGAALLHDIMPAVESAQMRMLQPLKPADRKALMALMAQLVDLNNEASRVPLRAEDALEHLGKAG